MYFNASTKPADWCSIPFGCLGILEVFLNFYSSAAMTLRYSPAMIPFPSPSSYYYFNQLIFFFFKFWKGVILYTLRAFYKWRLYEQNMMILRLLWPFFIVWRLFSSSSDRHRLIFFQRLIRFWVRRVGVVENHKSFLYSASVLGKEYLLCHFSGIFTIVYDIILLSHYLMLIQLNNFNFVFIAGKSYTICVTGCTWGFQ